MELDINLQPKQTALLSLVEKGEASWVGYGGSRGGAKSHGCRMVMVARRFAHPNTRGFIFRRKQKELRENHIEPLFRQFPLFRKWYNQQTNTINFPNKSAIIFCYAEHKNDIYDFQGSEAADIVVDEATHFTEEELTFLKTCCRLPGRDYSPKFILSMNPGNVGHSFCKRIFIDKSYIENEKPGDYSFVQAFGWDNIEWVRDSLKKDGIDSKESEKTYYKAWTVKERFSYFVIN